MGFKYYIIAGEASGDLHGANLIKAFQQVDSKADFRCWGGDLMEQAGAKIVKHYRDLAFMGFVEVVKNLRTILGNFKFCKSDILNYQPDVLILIDYPGFNLRMAKWAKANGIKVFYYISPQIWAWHTSRVHQIKKNIDRMFVILPFEKDFYRQFEYEVDFVGHPLLDHLSHLTPDDQFHARHHLDERPIIALLPGSRRQEISKMLKIFLTVIERFPQYQFLIAGAPSIPNSFYQSIIKEHSFSNNPIVIENKTQQVLQHAHAALVTSGTATLETALFKVPQVVCYTGNSLSFQLAKRLVKVDYISLVNLILGKPLVKELIQDEFNTKNLIDELNLILKPEVRNSVLEGYQALYEALGKKGASQRTAQKMVDYLLAESQH